MSLPLTMYKEYRYFSKKISASIFRIQDVKKCRWLKLAVLINSTIILVYTGWGILVLCNK